MSKIEIYIITLLLTIGSLYVAWDLNNIGNDTYYAIEDYCLNVKGIK